MHHKPRIIISPVLYLPSVRLFPVGEHSLKGKGMSKGNESGCTGDNRGAGLLVQRVTWGGPACEGDLCFLVALVSRSGVGAWNLSSAEGPALRSRDLAPALPEQSALWLHPLQRAQAG